MSQQSKEYVLDALIVHPRLHSPIRVKFYPHEDPSKSRGCVHIPIPEGPVKDTLEALMLMHIRNGVHFGAEAYLQGIVSTIGVMRPDALIPLEETK